jgi:hypothetical protein
MKGNSSLEGFIQKVLEGKAKRGGGVVSSYNFSKAAEYSEVLCIMKCCKVIPIEFASCICNYAKVSVKGKNDNCVGEE